MVPARGKKLKPDLANDEAGAAAGQRREGLAEDGNGGGGLSQEERRDQAGRQGQLSPVPPPVSIS